MSRLNMLKLKHNIDEDTKPQLTDSAYSFFNLETLS